MATPFLPSAVQEEIMTEIRELSETELDAVSGGFFNFLFASPITQVNTTTQVNAAIFGAGPVANWNATAQIINI